MRRDGPGSLLPFAFGAGQIDRAAHLRADEDGLAQLMRDTASRAYVIAGEAIVVRRLDGTAEPNFTTTAARDLGCAPEAAFLGLRDGAALFGLAMSETAAAALADRTDVAVLNLRQAAIDGAIPGDDLAAIAEAKSLLQWHARRAFCSNCGGRTASSFGGWRRDCAGCGAQHFPRTDPVVIMHVTDGDDCLLGRQSRFAPGMYSCLAGFVEPGETLEDAVRREMLEEAGVVCGAVGYVASQPWPYPSSLMIGCHARALTRDLAVDHDELEDARWFGRDEVTAMLAHTHPDGLTAPPPIAIARNLMQRWIDGTLPG